MLLDSTPPTLSEPLRFLPPGASALARQAPQAVELSFKVLEGAEKRLQLICMEDLTLFQHLETKLKNLIVHQVFSSVFSCVAKLVDEVIGDLQRRHTLGNLVTFQELQ